MIRLLLLFILGFLMAQEDIDKENPRFLQAKSMEKGGLYKEAENILISLNTEKPESSTYFAALKSMLKNKSDYDNLLKYSILHSDSRNNDLISELEVLESLILLDRKNEWLDMTHKLSKKHINDKESTILIINRLISLQKIDAGKKIIYNFRIENNDKYFYSLQLSNFLNMSMSYEESALELILYLDYQPSKINYISNRFMSFPNNKDINTKIEKILITSNVQGCQKILADLYLKQKKYTESYAILKNLDNSSYIFDFAADIVIVEEYALAVEVLKNLISSSKNQNIIREAIFEISKIVEVQSLQTNMESLSISNFHSGSPIFNSEFISIDESKAKDLNYSLSIYDSLGINNNIEAMLRLADLRYLVLGDLDGAMNTYKKIISKSRKNSQKFSSLNKITDIYISKGNLNQAQISVDNSKKNYLLNNQKIELGLKEIQINFYKSNFSESKNIAQNLLIDTPIGHHRYNDILSFLQVIILFDNHEAALKSFSEAQLKLKQNKRIEAIRILEEIRDVDDTIVMDLIKYQIAFLWYLQGEYIKSLDVARQLDSATIYSELALILMAEVNEIAIRDIARAIELYLDFLSQYPTSIFYDEIRIHIRELAS